MGDRIVKFWTCLQHAEELHHRDIASAVAELFDMDPLPETVEVYGYAPVILPSAEELAQQYLSPLRHLLALLDDEFSNPDGEATDPSRRMVEAELAFLRVVLEEYEVWDCERVETRTVRVQDYCSAPQASAARGAHERSTTTTSWVEQEITCPVLKTE